VSAKRQALAREMAARMVVAIPQGLIAFTSDVRDYARFLLHELELEGTAPVRVEVVLANGTRVKIQNPMAKPIHPARAAKLVRLERLERAALERGKDMLQGIYDAGRAKELDDACVALAKAEVPA
jgi:hypothetical protein